MEVDGSFNRLRTSKSVDATEAGLHSEAVDEAGGESDVALVAGD
jgi:hypothetical protein